MGIVPVSFQETQLDSWASRHGGIDYRMVLEADGEEESIDKTD